MTDQWQQERTEALRVACPYCKAPAGSACIVRGKPALIAVHKPRVRKAAAR